jgi:hypothetical protein
MVEHYQTKLDVLYIENIIPLAPTRHKKDYQRKYSIYSQDAFTQAQEAQDNLPPAEKSRNRGSLQQSHFWETGPYYRSRWV